MLDMTGNKFWFVGLPIPHVPGRALGMPAIAYTFQGRFRVVNRSGTTVYDSPISELKLDFNSLGGLSIHSDESVYLLPGGQMVNKKVAEKLISYLPESLTSAIVADAKIATQQGKLQSVADNLRQTASTGHLLSAIGQASFGNNPGVQMARLVQVLESQGATVESRQEYSKAAVWKTAAAYLIVLVLLLASAFYLISRF
jgi:hypothetical protein